MLEARAASPGRAWAKALAGVKRLARDPARQYAERALAMGREAERLNAHAEAILAALRRMGFAKEEMSGHGFRAMARTLLDEVLHVRPDYIEHQLAHAVRDPNGRAYNRTQYLTHRRAMMQAWADYLDRLKAGGVVLALAANG